MGSSPSTSQDLGTHTYFRRDGHLFTTNGAVPIEWTNLYGSGSVVGEFNNQLSILTLTFVGPAETYVFVYDLQTNILDTSRSGGMTGGIESHSDRESVLVFFQPKELTPTGVVDYNWRVVVTRSIFEESITVSVSIVPSISQTTSSPNST